MKPSQAILAFILVFAALLAVGCSAPQHKGSTAAHPAAAPSSAVATPPVANAPPVATAPQCANDAQCGLGPCGRCENGACIRLEGCCNTDSDCGAGNRCRAGRCR